MTGIGGKYIDRRTHKKHMAIFTSNRYQHVALSSTSSSSSTTSSSSSSSPSAASNLTVDDDDDDDILSVSSESHSSYTFNDSIENEKPINDITDQLDISSDTVRQPKYQYNKLHEHIEDLFAIRERHKAPKAIITSILAYVHKWYDKSDSSLSDRGATFTKQLPYSWQRCDALFDEDKPQFIKV
jgi:hypothetical protein